MRLVSRSESTEVLQDFQPGSSRLLRMELDAKNILALYSGRESAAVFAGGDGIIAHWCAIRVRVIDKSSALNATQEAARIFAHINPVPAHMRALHAGREAATLARK